MKLLIVASIAALVGMAAWRQVCSKDTAMLKIVSWHAFGLIDILVGSNLLVGALMTGGREGHLGFGVLLMGCGTWAWMRGVRARRSFARRSACA